MAWRDDMDRDEAVRMAVQALTDAADEDRGTGGVDLERGIFPIDQDLHLSRASRRRAKTEIAAVLSRHSRARVPRGGNL